VFNYGSFGMDKKRTASLPLNMYNPHSNLKSSFRSREALLEEKNDFKAVE